MGVITKEMSGMFILVAVITSIFTPIVFKKVFPFDNQQIKKTSVAIIGANQFTLPVYRELQTGLYEPTLYHTKQEKMTRQFDFINIKELEDYSIETLNETDIHDADIVVITTGEEKINAELGISFKEKGVERVICRAESPEIEEELRNNGIEVFSVLRSITNIVTSDD